MINFFSNMTTFSALVFSALLSVVAAPPPATSPACSLYGDSPMGMVCFHNDEITRAIATGGTSWLVEFYSSWCGHCQHFVPTWKKLAEDVSGWSSVVQLGVMDCSAKESYPTCTAYNIQGYPTMRFFHPGETDPKASLKHYHGPRKLPDLKTAILEHLESYDGPTLPHWPHFSPIEGDRLLTIPEDEWVPVAIVFEEQASYVGRELMLDLLTLKQLQVYRTIPTNLALVNHYSIMEFPSLVIESRKEDFIVVPGHSLDDPRREFRESVERHFRNIPQTLPPPSAAISQTQPPAADLETAKTQTTPLKINRVSSVDVLGAMSYVFRREIPLHSIVSGTAFTALLRLTHLLESVFTKAYPVIVPSLSLVRERLEMRLSAGFITNRDWMRLLDTKLNKTLFPRNPEWHNCRGSQSHYRGYPCALWMLAHTLTILTLPIQQEVDSSAAFSPKMTFRSKDALSIVSHFIQNFFSCDYCRDHFTEMARSLEGRVLYDGDAVLWLWEAHNVVNRRLAKDISSDPLYPKLPFPSPKRCPYCYKQMPSGNERGKVVGVTVPNWVNTGFRSRTDSFLAHNVTAEERNLVYTWNRTAVLLYLARFYNWNQTHSITQKNILQAAWPKLFTSSRQLYHRSQQGLGLTSYDMGFCVTYYMLCGALLMVVGYWLIRRRLRHFLHPYR